MSEKNRGQLVKLWEMCKVFLPVIRLYPQGGRPRQDDQACFFAIIWVLTSGARWRDLPEHFPSPVTCWRRHRDWTRAGVWQKVWERVVDVLRQSGKLQFEELMTDATFVAALKGGRQSA
jgi:transposase